VIEHVEHFDGSVGVQRADQWQPPLYAEIHAMNRLADKRIARRDRPVRPQAAVALDAEASPVLSEAVFWWLGPKLSPRKLMMGAPFVMP
jgi:hypothetical protein